jgi:hypothetical protein
MLRPAILFSSVQVFVVLMLGVLLPIAVMAETEAPDQAKVLSVSPDGRFQIRRIPSESGELGQARKALEITSFDGRTLYRWSSPIGATTTLWSPDSRYLAVNDAPGEGGDQLRVFRLELSKENGDSVQPIREPSAQFLRREAEQRHGNFLSSLDSVTLRALEWREGRLWCQVNGSFSPKRNPSVHVPFHDLWVFSLPKGYPVLEEVWTRSEPKEKAWRDTDKGSAR